MRSMLTATGLEENFHGRAVQGPFPHDEIVAFKTPPAGSID
jgi:hypothetical protein